MNVSKYSCLKTDDSGAFFSPQARQNTEGNNSCYTHTPSGDCTQYFTVGNLMLFCSDF
jgi:hypothetical protein